MTDFENQSLPVNDARGGVEGVLARGVKRQIRQLLSGFSDGQLSICWPDGSNSVHGTRSEKAGDNASVHMHSLLPFRRLMTNGQIGFAESYMRGEWSTDNLANLFALIMRNEDAIAPATHGGRMPRLMNLWRHWTKRNSLSGSQRNIAFHYDLGNDFYRLWLDESMSYSSGLYQHPTDTLEQAQQRKIDAVLDMLSPDEHSSVLEIGCGWGALAHNIASKSGASVTGISLSAEQLQYANSEHAKPIGAQEKNKPVFEHKDYRDVSGRFSHIVSIEMFEAVGQKFWQTYFNKIADLLDSGGTAVVQTITLLENRFEVYRAKPDFIQRYIFPGGMLPTKTLLKQHIERAGLVIESERWFGDSYAKTLNEWRLRFEQTSKEIKALGFDERFIRMWRYYLVYCETGFNIARTDVGLVKLRRL